MCGVPVACDQVQEHPGKGNVYMVDAHLKEGEGQGEALGDRKWQWCQKCLLILH